MQKKKFFFIFLLLLLLYLFLETTCFFVYWIMEREIFCFGKIRKQKENIAKASKLNNLPIWYCLIIRL